MGILLNDKTVLITNVSTTLGFALAQSLGFSGASLFVCDSHDQKLRKSVHDLKESGIKVAGAVVNVEKNDQRKKLFEEIQKKYNGLDAMIINNHPNTHKGDIISNSKMQFDEVYDKFLTTPFKLCRDAVPLLSSAKNGGSVVLMTSMAGFCPFEEIGLYSAVQTGLLGLTKAAAIDFAKKNIRVNSVALGMMKDDGSGAWWDNAESEKERVQKLAEFVPLGVPKSDQCGHLVQFLVSDRASYITGENCILNSGISCRI